MGLMFVVALVVPTPNLEELEALVGEVVIVSVAENDRDSELLLAHDGKQTTFLFHGLSLEERKAVRALRPGTEIKIWYWDPPFGLPLDVWQLKQSDKMIVPHENRLLEFQITRNLFLALGVILGAIAFLPYFRSAKRNA